MRTLSAPNVGRICRIAAALLAGRSIRTLQTMLEAPVRPTRSATAPRACPPADAPRRLTVIGPPRSGTTLLCWLLAGADRTLTISEPHLAAAALPTWRLHRLHRRVQVAAGLQRVMPPYRVDSRSYDAFLARLAQTNGFTRIVVKETWRDADLPQRWRNRGLLEQLAQGRTAYVIRHPADTVASTLRLARWITGWTGRLTRLRWPQLPHFRDRAAAARWAAKNWCEYVGWLDARGATPHRYEDLVRRPESTLHAICRELDLPYSDALLQLGRPRPALGGLGDPALLTASPRAIRHDAVGRGAELSAELRRMVWDVCASSAAALGYEVEQ
ncbi:MAG: hypothetical protein D6744_13820 [Planctomycetota bacterium]|nr:MAG: hypothetical protein D6744_13820 [Planctomycetota bacterium]